jgi:DNA integrity scanning protein DisA with diadenylate cyclase activity
MCLRLRESVCGVNNRTLRRVVDLAVEIAREGREGRKIGTLFVLGDSEVVLKHSTAGFSGHDPYRMMRMCGLDVEPV